MPGGAVHAVHNHEHCLQTTKSVGSAGPKNEDGYPTHAVIAPLASHSNSVEPTTPTLDSPAAAATAVTAADSHTRALVGLAAGTKSTRRKHTLKI